MIELSNGFDVTDHLLRNSLSPNQESFTFHELKRAPAGMTSWALVLFVQGVMPSSSTDRQATQVVQRIK
jgi:hypothetical protein